MVKDSETLQFQLVDRRDPGKKLVLWVKDDSCANGDFSPDGRWLALFCAKALQVWDLDHMDDASVPQLYPGSAYVFSPDGTLLALTNVKDKLIIVNPGMGSIQDVPSPALHNAVFSPDGRWFAGKTPQKEIWVWDLAQLSDEGPRTLLLVGGYDDPVVDLAFTADSLHLLSTSDDGITRKWDLLDPYAKSSSVPMPGWGGMTDLSYTVDGRWLVMNGTTRKSLSQQSALLDLQDPAKKVTSLYPWPVSLVSDPQGDRLVSVNMQTGDVESWPFVQPLKTGLPASPLTLPGQILNSRGGRWLMTRLGDDLQIRDLASPGAKPKTVPGLPFPANGNGSLGTNGKWLWLAGKEDALTLWDLEQPEITSIRLPVKVFPILNVEVSPRGRWLVTLSGDAVQIWDLTKPGREQAGIIPIQANGGLGHALLFSADDGRLVIDSKKALYLVDLQQPQPTAVLLPGQLQQDTGAAISADGNRLAAIVQVRAGDIEILLLSNSNSWVVPGKNVSYTYK